MHNKQITLKNSNKDLNNSKKVPSYLLSRNLKYLTQIHKKTPHQNPKAILKPKSRNKKLGIKPNLRIKQKEKKKLRNRHKLIPKSKKTKSNKSKKILNNRSRKKLSLKQKKYKLI